MVDSLAAQLCQGAPCVVRAVEGRVQCQRLFQRGSGLGRVAARQISGLGLGDLSRIDPDALGVIELTLGEKSALTPAPSEASGSIRAKIREGLSGFYESIGLIAYGLVVLLPWLLLAGLLGWVVVRVNRRRRRTGSGASTA